MSLLDISCKLEGKELSFHLGEIAKQTNGAVLVKSGGTVVLVTACMKRELTEGVDFFPLTVDYQEKTYAAGRIPGGFFKREGRAKESEILSARLVDRSIRPLFPSGMRNAVQVICIVLSSDAENDPDVLAVNGAAVALGVSDIPFSQLIGCVRVGRIAEKFVVNPTYKEREESSLDIVVSATKDKVMMIEAKASNLKEDIISEAIKFAHRYIKGIIMEEEKIKDKLGKEKLNLEFQKVKEDLATLLRNKTASRWEDIYREKEKQQRQEKKDELLTALIEELEDGYTEEDIKLALAEIEEDYVRHQILDKGVRPDGRKIDEIREINCKVGVLPRTHGSALFTRGQTQSLAVTTLGTSSDEQRMEELEGESFKHFMLHYSFPPFSVGEVSFLRAPSRREIGHGALAEKALSVFIPPKEKFPYTIRVVSEILESNGSSSMATVCAASLSLMDAGVPLPFPVAGIALGLITDKDNERNYKILTDIAGIEDHCGDMDFKVAGTREGVTAIQVDLKIDGIGYDIIEEALLRAKAAREIILEKMEKVLSAARPHISEYAPRIKVLKINVDKIGELIGPGGRNIKRIIKETGADIDIKDDTGEVIVASTSEEGLNKAIEYIESITKDIEVGEVYTAKVVKVTNFGAFCEIAPGKSGLLHISQISDGFVKDVSEYLKENDTIKVKVIGIDEQGRINLSRKHLNEGKDK